MHVKADIINEAYSRIKINGITTNPTGGEMSLGLQRLEEMAAEFDLRINYNFEDQPDPNSPTNVEKKFWNALSSNLAVRLAPDFGKEVSQSLMAQASQSLSNMIGATAIVRPTPYPSRQPIGSGNSLRIPYHRFYNPEGRAPNDASTNIIRVDGVNDYAEHFDAYLNRDESITSYVIDSDSGLFLVSHANASPDINYRVRAVGSIRGTGQQVWIRITTSAGREETRRINFSVQPTRLQ